MANITLHNDRDHSATYVSNAFIDYYMTTANGEYVKIYLYLLRCMNSPDSSFSISQAADRFEHTEKDIQRALKYWEKMKLLRLEYDSANKLSGIYFLDSSGSNTTGKNEKKNSAGFENRAKASAREMQETKNVPQADPAVISAAASHTATIQPANQDHINTTSADESGCSREAQPASQKHTANSTGEQPQKRTFTADELSAFQEKENVRELLFVTEHYLKRPLSPTDINTILFWYDELAFSTDLIEYLIEHCVGKGHTSLYYMDKVAMGWKDDGVTTIAQAKCVSSAYSKTHFAVMRALGISGRNLVPDEISCINKWFGSYGFTQDIINEACRRTISATHQPSISYADKILKSWHENKVRNISDIAKLDSARQKAKTAAKLEAKAAAPNKFNNFSQRTYDYDKLEEQLLNH